MKDEMEGGEQMPFWVEQNPPTKGAVLAVGDRVAFAASFLRSAGLYTGGYGQMRGTVLSLHPLDNGRREYATVQWDGDEEPRNVLTVNLVRKDRIHLEPNPPGDIHVDIHSHNGERENPPGYGIGYGLEPKISEVYATLGRDTVLKLSDLSSLTRGQADRIGEELERGLRQTFPNAHVDVYVTHVDPKAFAYSITPDRIGRKDMEAVLLKAIRVIVGKASSYVYEGDEENPPHTHSPRMAGVEVYRHVLEIRAEKKNGKKYVHKFKRGSRIIGLPDGSLLIKGPRRLWKEFTVDGKGRRTK